LVKQGAMPAKAAPKHLLWALFFLKVYTTENVAAVIMCCDEKTIRLWSWVMVGAIAGLDCVSSFCLDICLFLIPFQTLWHFRSDGRIE
jgi:hypothetical protein